MAESLKLFKCVDYMSIVLLTLFVVIRKNNVSFKTDILIIGNSKINYLILCPVITEVL